MLAASPLQINGLRTIVHFYAYVYISTSVEKTGAPPPPPVVLTTARPPVVLTSDVSGY